MTELVDEIGCRVRQDRHRNNGYETGRPFSAHVVIPEPFFSGRLQCAQIDTQEL